VQQLVSKLRCDTTNLTRTKNLKELKAKPAEYRSGPSPSREGVHTEEGSSRWEEGGLEVTGVSDDAMDGETGESTKERDLTRETR